MFCEFIESYKSQDSINSTTNFFYKTCRSQESSARREEVIDDDDIFSLFNRSFLYFDTTFSVFERVGCTYGFTGEFSFFTNHDKWLPKYLCNWYPKEKSSSIESSYDVCIFCSLREFEASKLHCLRAGQKRRNILESDSWFWEIFVRLYVIL